MSPGCKSVIFLPGGPAHYAPFIPHPHSMPSLGTYSVTMNIMFSIKALITSLRSTRLLEAKIRSSPLELPAPNRLQADLTITWALFAGTTVEILLFFRDNALDQNNNIQV